MKQRAIQQSDKDQRRQELLDAALVLWQTDPNRLRIEAVAKAAGVAKGTVYLYFRSKEEILLAIHERHVAAFFAALRAGGEQGTIAFETMMELVFTHMVRVPAFLPLASLCHGLMESGVEPEIALGLKHRIGERLGEAGHLLQSRLGLDSPEKGVAFLMHGYGLILGLWQILHPSPLRDLAKNDPAIQNIDRDFETELRQALRALWLGELGSTKGAP